GLVQRPIATRDMSACDPRKHAEVPVGGLPQRLAGACTKRGGHRQTAFGETLRGRMLLAGLLSRHIENLLDGVGRARDRDLPVAVEQSFGDHGPVVNAAKVELGGNLGQDGVIARVLSWSEGSGCRGRHLSTVSTNWTVNGGGAP